MPNNSKRRRLAKEAAKAAKRPKVDVIERTTDDIEEVAEVATEVNKPAVFGVCSRCDRSGLIHDGKCAGFRMSGGVDPFEARSKRCDAIAEARERKRRSEALDELARLSEGLPLV